MILDAPLGDVVQEQRDIEQLAMPGWMVRMSSLADCVLAARRARCRTARRCTHQMLVHRVVVVHVELHHRHDPAELGDETAEHAGLVHAPQDGFGGVLRCQDLQEQPIGLGIVAQRVRRSA